MIGLGRFFPHGTIISRFPGGRLPDSQRLIQMSTTKMPTLALTLDPMGGTTAR